MRQSRDLDAWLKEPVVNALAERGYTLLEKVGGGGFAHVYKCVKEGKAYAVKIEEPNGDEMDRQRQEKRLRREMRIHQKLSHPNIVQFCEAIELPVPIKWPIIVMELVVLKNQVCDLTSLIKRMGRVMGENEAAYIFRELLRGVEYMHQVLKTCHRDIKLDNALVDDNGKVKLCDFGLSKMEGEDSVAKSAVGTILYMPPELARNSGQSYNGAAVDVWCCGILLYHLVSGHTPFECVGDNKLNRHQHTLALQARILANPLEIKCPQTLSEDSMCWDLIQQILNPDPAQRPSIDEIKRHRFYITNMPYGWDEESRALMDKSRIETISEADLEQDDYLFSISCLLDPSFETTASFGEADPNMSVVSMQLQSSDQLLCPPADDIESSLMG